MDQEVLDPDTSTPGVVREWRWLDPDSSGAVMEALANYRAAMFILHPFDWGPMVIAKVAMMFHFFGGANVTGAEAKRTLVLFINFCLERNANRAGNKKPPLDYDLSLLHI